MPKFGSSSIAQLKTCHPDLQRLFLEVIKHVDCQVLQGARTVEEELQHIKDGTSKLTDPKNSKHVTFPERPLALAVDVAPYPVDWEDLKRFSAFGGFVLGVASQMGLKIRWGHDWDGDWDFKDQKFEDYPHFEVIL